MRILIASPIPSHPQDQGNSARIYALGRLFQAAGMTVHFLYYQMEGLLRSQRLEMEACWDHLHTVPTARRHMQPTGAGHYRLDDWDDGEAAEQARALHRRYRFGAVVANYVWFSRVLEALDGDVVKLLDTHDVFGDRDARMREAGLAPEWFYTTPAEEARGLARADIVLAIQDEEAAQFRRLGHGDVRVVGHMLGRRYRHPRMRDGGKPAVGYLASGNPHNVGAFEAMRHRLAADPRAAQARYLVAGTICRQLVAQPAPFEAIGRIDHVDQFYDQVDLVLNPMTTGTGLKIKSVEALFQGMPLVATASAMTGLPADHALHRLRGPEAVADWALSSRFAPAELLDLAAASRACAARYADGVRHAVGALVADLRGDRPAASRARSSSAKIAGSSHR